VYRSQCLVGLSRGTVVDIEKAKEITTALANGIDPATGEVFADDSPYNNPLAIRTLFTVLNHTQQSDKRKKLSIEEKQAQNVEIGKPKNDGLAWAETLRNL